MKKTKTIDFKSAFRAISVSLLVIAFFIGIVLMYYRMLYNKEKELIIKNGEISALQTATEFNEYLATSLDAIYLTAYTLNGMLDDNRSTEDIRNYLVVQSDAVINAIFENTTGIYGYINGEYLDGAGWVPDEDYVATQRPWYVKAMEKAGDVAIIEPYRDMQTGDIMMTLAKALNDGKSVVAFDISLDRIQEITEEVASEDGDKIELILDRNDTVIAHSNREEFGKNYAEEKGTLGAVLAEKLHSSPENYFEFDYSGAHYIAYSSSIVNDWQCVSIKDASKAFASLRRILLTTIGIILLIVLALSILMSNNVGRRFANERLSKQLSSISNIYMTTYECNILDDTFIEIKSDKQYVDDLVGGEHKDAQKTLFDVMGSLCDPSSAEELHRFLDMGTLEDRLGQNNTITIEYMNRQGLWRRGRFIVSRRARNGRLTHVMWLVEDINIERAERDKLTKDAELLNSRISSISNIYMTVHEIDLDEDTFTEIQNSNRKVSDIISTVHSQADEMFRKIMLNVCDKSCVDDAVRFCDLSTLANRLAHTDTITTEYCNPQKNWFRGRFIVSARNDSGRVTRVLYLSENIDAEKAERDKLIDMSERAVAASEAKSSFLSNMSHEIRTPINAVLGMNEMILRECSDKNILGYSESIKTAGTTLLGIVNDILDFSKIEAGKMEIIPVDYDLSSVINDLVNMIQTRAEDKGLRLELDICREVPKLLHGDEVRIKQIVTNILSNAVKYTERGMVTLCIGYERISGEPDSIMLDISVKDTGIGIKKEDMKKLFSEFDRIEEERNRNVEGTGLGMSITKRLLEMMGSSLEVESIYGLGSKFSFSLKQSVVNWDALGDYETAYKDSIGSREKYHAQFRASRAEALVVDDTPMNLLVFSSLLKQTGIKIDTANSGDEGLSLAFDKKYDIIFLDHMMPDKDGIQTLHELRERENDPNHNTPVICLTANAISGAREKYLSEGFDNYLTKPIDSVKLEEMLIEYLPKEKLDPVDDENAKEETSDAAPVTESSENDSLIPAYIRDISEIDICKGITNSGSEEIYLETLKIYADMVKKQADEAEQFFKAGDIKDATIKIHALKSSSRIIGATSLGDLAQELENAGKEGDTQKLQSHMDELLDRLRGVGDALSPLIKDNEADESDLPLISEDELQEMYAAIREFISVSDYDSALDLIEVLKTYSVPDNEKDRRKALINAADEVRYEDISEILK